jgi:alcohol dehydrogenase (NADP+)
MSTTISAYAATSAADPLSATTITRRDVGPHDAAFDIHFAGICHTDIHIVRGEWGPAAYPVVPGHEIAGIVTQVGADVTKYKVGDRVGVGCFVDSCRQCQPLDAAAPVLCAGVTVYSPLRHWNTGPGSRVAVIGLGGLGHLGVKFAKAMGAEVTVLSQSLKKMEDGLRLGADAYYATSDPDTFTKLTGSFDLILNTVSANLDMGDYLGLLATNGTLVELGLPEYPMVVPAFPLAAGRRSVAGSLMGGIHENQEMLNFCAQHGVQPEIEVIAPDYINEAYERVLASDVRYRFVIDTASLR